MHHHRIAVIWASAVAAALLAPWPASTDEVGFSNVQTEIRKAEKGRDWMKALGLTRRLLTTFRGDDYLPLHARRQEIGDFYLKMLDLQSAEREFRRVLQSRGQRGSSNLDTWQTAAAYGLARVHAERADFDRALTWLDQYRTAFGS